MKLYTLKEKYNDDPTCANSFLYYIFSIFCKHGYIGETIDITMFNILLALNTPTDLRKPLEHQLITWFKPSLNSLQNSDFKLNVLENPSIPPVLKLLLSLLRNHTRSL